MREVPSSPADKKKGFDYLNANLSPMSDRGGSEAGTGTDNASSRPRAAQGKSPMLPSTVTRRVPGGGAGGGSVPPMAKRTITPRGKRNNPFANVELIDAGFISESARREEAPSEAPSSSFLQAAKPAAPLGGCVAAPRPVCAVPRPKRSAAVADPFANAMVPDVVVGQISAVSSPPTILPSPPKESVTTTSITRKRSPRLSPANETRKSSGRVSVDKILTEIQSARNIEGVSQQQAKNLTPPSEASSDPQKTTGVSFPEEAHDTNTHSTLPGGSRTSQGPSGRRSLSRGREIFEDVKGVTSVCAQVTFVILALLIAFIGGVYYCLPLLETLDSAEDALVKEYVASLARLQSVYQVPVMGLNESDTRCLYLRVLQDGTEELDRVVAKLSPVGSGASYQEQRLRLLQVARAHHMLRHRARLYSRSRDGTLINHLFFYPFRDAIVYGLKRHGWWDTFVSLVWRPQLQDIIHRIADVGVCVRQSEQLPCPSMAYLEEKAERKLRLARGHRGGSGQLDSNSLEYLNELAKLIIEGSGRSNSWYNDKYCSRRYGNG